MANEVVTLKDSDSNTQVVSIASGGTGATSVADAVKNLTISYRIGGWNNLGNNNTQLTSVQDVIDRANAVGQYKVFISGITSALTPTLTGVTAGGIFIGKWADTDRIDYLALAGNKNAFTKGTVTISTATVSYSEVGGLTYDLITSW